MNRVILHGNAGSDPEAKTTESGKRFAKFSLATSEHGKDKDGNHVASTTWHNIIAWEKYAERIEKHVRKGTPLIVEGKISYRAYTDKNGVDRSITEIVCNSFHLTGSKKEEPSLASI